MTVQKFTKRNATYIKKYIGKVAEIIEKRREFLHELSEDFEKSGAIRHDAHEQHEALEGEANRWRFMADNAEDFLDGTCHDPDYFGVDILGYIEARTARAEYNAMKRLEAGNDRSLTLEEVLSHLANEEHLGSYDKQMVSDVLRRAYAKKLD